MFGFIGDVIGGIGSIASGLLGSKATKKAADTSLEQTRESLEAQKEFAQHGVRWRVEDAKAAGLHPLFALGANTATYTPSPVSVAPDLSWSNTVSSLGQMGQDIGRSIQATRTQRERDERMVSLQMQNAQLQNEMLAAQRDLINSQVVKEQSSLVPSFPSAVDGYMLPGQSSSGLIRPQPLEPIASQPGRPSQEVGAVPDYGYTRTPSGFAPVMSADAKERLEEDLIGVLAWNLRNRLLPTLGLGSNAPVFPLSQDQEWSYSPLYQEYRPVKRSSRGRSRSNRYVFVR